MRIGPIGKPEFFIRGMTNTGILLLSANQFRFYSLITNDSNVKIWIFFGRQNVFGEGIPILGNGFAFEIDSNNMYRGDVYGIHGSSGTKNIAVFDGS